MQLNVFPEAGFSFTANVQSVNDLRTLYAGIPIRGYRELTPLKVYDKKGKLDYTEVLEGPFVPFVIVPAAVQQAGAGAVQVARIAASIGIDIGVVVPPLAPIENTAVSKEELAAQSKGVSMAAVGFENYTGERAGYFYDPNWREYFPISGHSGSYQNWETGVRSTAGAQAAYSEPSRQIEYLAEVKNLPKVTLSSLVAVDLARTAIPGSPQSIASQPIAVPQTLSTTPAATPTLIGSTPKNAEERQPNWLGWGVAIIGLWLVFAE